MLHQSSMFCELNVFNHQVLICLFVDIPHILTCILPIYQSYIFRFYELNDYVYLSATFEKKIYCIFHKQKAFSHYAQEDASLDGISGKISYCIHHTWNIFLWYEQGDEHLTEIYMQTLYGKYHN